MGMQLKIFVILGLLFVLHHSHMRSAQTLGLGDSEEDGSHVDLFTHQRERKKFHGCYQEAEVRIFKHNFNMGSWVTVDRCVDICAAEQYVFAGIDHSQCWCGNILRTDHRNPKVTGSKCNHQCNSGGGLCGKHWANTIYETGYEIIVIKPDGTQREIDDTKFWACMKSNFYPGLPVVYHEWKDSWSRNIRYING